VTQAEPLVVVSEQEKAFIHQKQELHVVAMFANRSGRNEQSS
jgi:hypothetical protein